MFRMFIQAKRFTTAICCNRRYAGAPFQRIYQQKVEKAVVISLNGLAITVNKCKGRDEGQPVQSGMEWSS